MGGVDSTTARQTVETLWAQEILPSLQEFIAIPALSPNFDADWETTGALDAAVEHLRAWICGRGIDGAVVEPVRLPGLSPLLVVDIPATEGAPDNGTVLLYGHLDKQPPVGGWSEGLGPWTPVLRDGKLYGRGSADDGYAGYAATAAVEAVRAAGGQHGRCVVLLETGEESGSPDLPAYLDHLADRLGEVSLVVCLDSGGHDYERLWLTTSLRGLVSVDLTVRVLESGSHSGLASGVVPSSFRVVRQLLDRVEDSETGEVRVKEMHVEVPDERAAEAAASVAAAPGAVKGAFPLAGTTRTVSGDEVELVLNNTWRPTLSVIGASGFPEPLDAGNVLRPFTTLTLSFRLPPTASSEVALAALRDALTADVPYGAGVELSRVEAADGWNAPPLAPWLRAALDEVSTEVFGAPWRASGLGGSIPFMGLLAEKYPTAQFVITGALGSDSNAHVPDEWLHVKQAERVTTAVAHVLDAHARS
ncbi:M20/M25/M40 family metallo-hydrolase [Actinokineospora bangkokensis]|uniref:Peptidase M20 n=1 Tax=Actinokineospora bangkokensis TaxID=1193682 RepID=A0A1Q9LGY8_9PSEU|nr:M20/M25/M40 family metallo-hydrolase [Actinokineospora bangkokensis]OLR91209.1 peptidase M20 [Actinokineospora bangkokensis]